MVFTEQQLQVKKLVDVQQDIEIDALNDGIGALSSTMQNGFTEAANNFSDIQNNLEVMNLVANDRYNELTGAVNTLSNAINTYNDQITNDFSVKNLTVDTMTLNVSAEPVNSLVALGYDANGKVIPVTVMANHNIILPPNADYIYTDSLGQPRAGVVDTTVSENDGLVTSHAVYNAVNDIWTDFNEFHNETYRSFGGIQHQFNGVNSTFGGVQNQFNNVDIQFNNVNSQFNNVNNNISGVESNLNELLNALGIYTPMNYINSSSPVNYTSVTNVVFEKGTTGNLWSEQSILGNKYYNWDAATNTLTFSSPLGIMCFNSDMSNAFRGCNEMNSFIPILNGVTNMYYAFYSCDSFNQPITIPNSITDMNHTFSSCRNFNQPITIPNSVTNMASTFMNCYNFNQPITIQNSVTDMNHTFSSCRNFNQPITIPNSVTNMSSTFVNCDSFNQPITIPNSVTRIDYAFYSCDSFNQPITIPNSVTNMYGTFNMCTNFNQDVYLYSDKLTDMRYAFSGCAKLADRNIHIRSTIPLDTTNSIYNALVNNYTGIDWTGRIYNDL